MQLRVEHHADVGAGAESPSRAGHHDRAHTGIGVGGLDRVRQFGGHARRPRVQAVGPVEREDDDVVVLFPQDLLVLHGATLGHT